MLKRLEEIERRYAELGNLLSNPKIIADQENFQKYSREHSSLIEMVEVYQKLKKVDSDLKENRAILEGKDEDLRELANAV